MIPFHSHTTGIQGTFLPLMEGLPADALAKAGQHIGPSALKPVDEPLDHELETEWLRSSRSGPKRSHPPTAGSSTCRSRIPHPGAHTRLLQPTQIIARMISSIGFININCERGNK
jgi:hypothetical protein